MSNPLKSFSELGEVYMTDVLLSESKKQKDNDFGFKKAGTQKGAGPEAAEGFKKLTTEKKAAKTNVKKKEDTEEEKMAKESIETPSNMQTKKLSFEELYERAMSEGPDSVVSTVEDPATNFDADDNATPDVPGDVANVGDETEVVDPKELFSQICELVEKLKKHYGVEDEFETEEPMGDDEGGDIEDLSKESVETQELPNSKGQTLQGKNNKVGGVKSPGKGKAETGKLTSDPDPKPLGDKGKTLQGKNNKVAGSGAQSKQGASVFES